MCNFRQCSPTNYPMKKILCLIVNAWIIATSSLLSAQPVAPPGALDQARVFYQQSQLDSTTYYAHQEIAASHESQRWNDYAYALSWLGDTYRREQYYDSAFHYLSRALVTVVSSPVQDTTLAQTHHNMGLYYKDTRQPAQAVQMYEKAIAVRETLDDSIALAVSYNALATVYRFTYYDYLKAEEYYQQALQLLESSDEIKKTFDALYSLATTYRLKEDYDEALAYGYRAVDLAQQLSSFNREVCFTMLGNIFQDIDNTESAIANFQRALSLGIARLGNSDPVLMRRYNNLATVYIKADSVSLGMRMLSQSLRIYASAPQAGREDDLADTYEYLGDAYSKQRMPDSANYYYHRSLSVNKKTHGFKHSLTSEILSTLGKLHQQQQTYDSALHYFQQSLMAGVPSFSDTNQLHQPTVATMQNDPLNFRLLYQKARVLLDQYQQSSDTQWLLTALDCFARADSLIDSCRVLYDREAAKLGFLEDNKMVYEDAVGCAYQLYRLSADDTYLEWAFHFMEKSKAVVLWEALVDSQIKSGVGIPDSLVERERSINTSWAYTNNELWQAHQSGASASRVADLRAQQFALTREREAFTQHLESHYPAYFRIKYGGTSFTLHQARDYAGIANTTLIEYLWGQEYVYALSLNSQEILFKQIPLADTTQRALSSVLQALQHPPHLTQSQQDYHAYTAAAFHLYQQLLQPLLPTRGLKDHSTSPGLFRSIQAAQQQAYASTVTLIPDGPLAYLPFEALLTDLPSSSAPDYRHLAYVLDKHTISYAQSAQVLTQRTLPTIRTRNAMRFLGFGYSTSSDTKSTSSWYDLPGTAHEIKALEQMAEGTFYLGRSATEHRFKSEAEHYDMIHLAVHGLADTLNPNNSRLVFRADQDSIDDGLLYSYELYDLQLRADLAVLSSCESGMGRWQQGEGVYSLARGFTYAGCPTVVMSLWNVDDQQTARIMPTFYKGLYTGARVDQALRTAKLQYRQQCSHFFAHPAFWSSFVVEGNPLPIVNYLATQHAAWLTLVLSTLYFGMTLFRTYKNRQARRRRFA